MDCDFEICFKTVLDLSKTAGKTIRDAFYQEKRIETKSCSADLVTETDQKVEKFLISSLKENFPSHSFIGEETTAAGGKCNLTDNPTWIIDPIDGTTNFVHRFPFTCISIALVVKKEAEIGVVYNPILEDMYTARRGQGAFLNGKPIHVSDTKDLSQALVCAEFGSSRNPQEMDLKVTGMRNVIEKAHGVRNYGTAALNLCTLAAGGLDAFCLHDGIHCWDYAAGDLIVREAGGFTMDNSVRMVGSTALNLCMVASGAVDAFYNYGLHCWDHAAGELIVREADGCTRDVKGGPVDLMARRILAGSTEELVRQLAEKMVHVEYERD